MEKDLKILEKVSLFDGINVDGIETVLECLDGKVKCYGKNQNIILAGDKFTSLGIVICGSIQISKDDILGNRMIIAGLEAGDIFGETFSCAGIDISPVSVFALVPSKILWLTIGRIVSPCHSACDFHSNLIMNLLKLLATKNIYLNNKMDLLSRRSLKDKILAYLVAQANAQNSSTFTIPLNRNELADYLCIDRSALSRELGKLREDGIIEFHKNSFQLKDVQNS